MTVIDVAILGDLTFRGVVVGKRYLAGLFSVPDEPKVGEVIVLEKLVGGAASPWAGSYYVTEVKVECSSGFGMPRYDVTVYPV